MQVRVTTHESGHSSQHSVLPTGAASGVEGPDIPRRHRSSFIRAPTSAFWDSCSAFPLYFPAHALPAILHRAPRAAQGEVEHGPRRTSYLPVNSARPTDARQNTRRRTNPASGAIKDKRTGPLDRQRLGETRQSFLGFRLRRTHGYDPPAFLSSTKILFLPASSPPSADRVRVVPGVRRVRTGAYVAPSVICMPPMFINGGAPTSMKAA